jgi:hypothetical protein
MYRPEGSISCDGVPVAQPHPAGRYAGLDTPPDFHQGCSSSLQHVSYRCVAIIDRDMDDADAARLTSSSMILTSSVVHPGPLNLSR